MATMRISQLAERSGVPATTLRFYDDRGLLAPGRTPAGYRQYGEDALERLAFISAAKHLGLALDEIAELLAVWETGACADVKADLRPRVAARLTEARQRLAEGARPVGIRGGVRVTLPVGKVGAVAELAAAEQRCCPFFDFRLLLDGGAVHLEVRAPAEAADLINELFAP